MFNRKFFKIIVGMTLVAIMMSGCGSSQGNVSTNDTQIIENTESDIIADLPDNDLNNVVDSDDVDDKSIEDDNDGLAKEVEEDVEEVSLQEIPDENENSGNTISDEIRLKYEAFLKGEEKADFYGEMEYIPSEEWFLYGNSEYTFLDLNNDGVEELLINCWGGWLNTITYKYGNLHYVDSPFYSGASGETILDNNMIIMEDCSHAGRNYYEVYELNKDSEYAFVESFAYWYSDENTGITEDEYLYYNIVMDDSISISREEYLNKLCSYYEKTADISWENELIEGENFIKNTITPINTRKMTFTEKVYKSFNGEYVGNLGDKFVEYKDFTLSQELTNCNIYEKEMENETREYVVTSNGEEIFTVSNLEIPTNGTAMFYMHDINGDGIDEVLVVTYIDSTGGLVVNQATDYMMDENGDWKGTDIYTYEDKLINRNLHEKLLKMAAEKNEYGTYKVADFETVGEKILVLIDFGVKEGPDQYYDYTAVSLWGNDSNDEFYIEENIAQRYWMFDLYNAIDMSERLPE